MIRRIIKIDEEKCNGCGLCAAACHEGAIGILDGKAKLLRDDYCDGLGDCLPACPMNAISFEMREALAYDEIAVLAAKVKRVPNAQPAVCSADASEIMGDHCGGCLMNFPIQIKLVPENAAFLNGCDLLIAADCCAYACEDFHRNIMSGKVTLIGCPKLDGETYAIKLSQLFRENDIRSITVARMTVPCCGGLAYAVKKGIELSEKDIPVNTVVIAPDGRVQ